MVVLSHHTSFASNPRFRSTETHQRAQPIELSHAASPTHKRGLQSHLAVENFNASVLHKQCEDKQRGSLVGVLQILELLSRQSVGFHDSLVGVLQILELLF